jgi:hypothetical protein
VGSIMSYSIRDPSVFATPNVVNRDTISYFHSLSGVDIANSLTASKLAGDVPSAQNLPPDERLSATRVPLT